MISIKVNLPKLDNSSLWDKTYAILKERLIRRDFKPNEKLSIPELAEKLGVSRTPIRDALNRLEMEGLVKTISKVGTFVKPIEVGDVLDIMDTRLMLEFWTVDKIASSPSTKELTQTLTKMDDILVHSSRLIDSSVFESYLQADFNLAFHLEFIKLGKNQKNIEIYQNLMNYRFVAMKSSLISKEMVVTAQDQHYSIINSLKGGDIGDIKKVIQLHMEDSKERLLNKLKTNGGII
ncbi:GntR family transcriptional regulator [Paenibacillus sp. LMG 31456]|uniref:GntR family transcriptional regulator n=1 Tax=Paenibacillus foliorum TaxID=2654974 RepID=A0A972JZ12_9BACL|nr:GntR family transcriptional regulator [Paenibacillus foliorum]NOU93126.1 GntR family transcriptional regulator [Paenibacillus foliorum]